MERNSRLRVFRSVQEMGCPAKSQSLTAIALGPGNLTELHTVRKPGFDTASLFRRQGHKRFLQPPRHEIILFFLFVPEFFCQKSVFGGGGLFMKVIFQSRRTIERIGMSL